VKGVILAGGEGTRLRHLAEQSGVSNKHAVEVGGQPMITHPLRTLGEWGCKDVVIVTSPKGENDIREIVGDGSQFEMGVEYAIQKEPLGTANALQQTEGRLDAVFPLICGDVYVDPTPQPSTTERPTLFYTNFPLGIRHTVYFPASDETPAELIEKPSPELMAARNADPNAVMFYFYDPEVFDVIPSLKQTARGELELEDLHRHYLEKYGPEVMQEHIGFAGDMGTPEGLARVEDYIESRENK
jgi:glucose-1-phosphate thymidylyltransferase